VLKLLDWLDQCWGSSYWLGSVFQYNLLSSSLPVVDSVGAVGREISDSLSNLKMSMKVLQSPPKFGIITDIASESNTTTIKPKQASCAEIPTFYRNKKEASELEKQIDALLLENNRAELQARIPSTKELDTMWKKLTENSSMVDNQHVAFI
jgi:hypothetical protein